MSVIKKGDFPLGCSNALPLVLTAGLADPPAPGGNLKELFFSFKVKIKATPSVL